MATESFPHQQEELFPESPQPAFDVSAVANAIAAQAPNDPYAAQNKRAEEIRDRRGEDLAAEQVGSPAEANQQSSAETERKAHEGQTGHVRKRPEQKYWKDGVEPDSGRRRKNIAWIREIRGGLESRNARER